MRTQLDLKMNAFCFLIFQMENSVDDAGLRALEQIPQNFKKLNQKLELNETELGKLKLKLNELMNMRDRGCIDIFIEPILKI